MSSRDHREKLLRQARFESFEERLVLSAQPIADVVASQPDAAQPQAEYGEVAATLADVNQTTGVNYAHESFGFTGSGQTVAVIDTGIAYDHTALGGGFGAGQRVVGGWDFAENDANPYDDGPFGFHGTHVAGIVGSDHATHTGVAPDADLVALRVFDDLGNSNLGWVESALEWVHDHRNEFNITTVNLSLGTTWNADNVPNWATLEDEFQQLENDDIFISVAAGNSFASYNSTGLSYPAASPYVVPVASHGNDGLMSGFSQRNDRVIVAPGEQITSTIPSHLFGGSGASSYFMSASGTSMAAPYVAGASVVMREAMEFAGYQNITQDTIYDHFRATADMVYDSATGASYHRMDLQNALDTLLADEYGSVAANAHSLGTLNGGETFDGMIGKLGDVDFFTFTAGKSGTIEFSADVTHDMTPEWQVVGGSGANGETLSLDVEAGQTYTIGLGSSDGMGHYSVTTQLDSGGQSSSLSELAYNLEQQHDLQFTGNFYENLLGQGEKWLKGNDGWYFMKQDGGVYHWTGSLNSSELVGTLDATYHADPSKLYEAAAPNADKPSDPDSSSSIVQTAYNLDQQLDLKFTGSYYENLLGQGEKWLKGNDAWYFVTQDGSVNRWTGSLSASETVGTLDASYHADPSKLFDAPGPTENSGSEAGTSLAQTAYDLDQQYDFEFNGKYENLLGQGEKWLKGDDAWYFVKQDGGLYRWTGSVNTSELVGTLDESYHADPSKLSNAPNPSANTESVAGTNLAQTARDLDQQHNLNFTGNYYENLLGQGEKWLQGNDAWYFVKQDGGVYRWTGNVDTSELVGTLDASYHADPSKLFDATSSAATANSLAGTSVDQTTQSASQTTRGHTEVFAEGAMISQQIAKTSVFDESQETSRSGDSRETSSQQHDTLATANHVVFQQVELTADESEIVGDPWQNELDRRTLAVRHDLQIVEPKDADKDILAADRLFQDVGQ